MLHAVLLVAASGGGLPDLSATRTLERLNVSHPFQAITSETLNMLNVSHPLQAIASGELGWTAKFSPELDGDDYARGFICLHKLSLIHI